MTPSPLPALRVRLFGRDRDAAAVRSLLATTPGRLVTILGPGGCGKTSLALEVVHQAVPALADDGYWVALDACTEPSAVPRVITAALGTVEEATQSAAAGIAAALEDRQAVLVLDNCEHVRAAVAPLVDTLLSKCPDLRILTTSRAPLNVQGEHLFLLDPLPVPTRRDRLGADLANVPSVALFLDRSRAAGRVEPVTPAQLDAVSRICTLVDGLPLAIELAAAQTLVFSAEHVAEHLEASLPLPPRTTMVGPERQKTMQGTLDWSYQLLADSQKRLLTRSGVFAGDWTLEAMGAVSPDSGDIAVGVSRLVEHSLITPVDAGGERRYQLMGPVREYARLLQDEAGETGELRERHARYYARLLDPIARKHWSVLLTRAQVQTMNLEHENCLAALAYAHEEGDGRLAFHLTNAMLVFWRLKGQLHLGRAQFQALAEMALLRRDQLALAHAGIANFEQLLGNRQAATEHATLALSIFRECGHLGGELVSVAMLAEVASEDGNYPVARQRYHELMSLVPDRAPADMSTGLAIFGLGVVEHWDGNLEEADRLLRKAIALMGEANTWHRGLAHIHLGSVAGRSGRVDEALAEIREGLAIVERLGGAQEFASGLEALAAVEHLAGRDIRAATFLGAARALRDSTRSPAAAADVRANDALLAAVQGALSEAEFASAWVSGRGLSRADMLALALGDAPSEDPPVAPLSSLTGRELQVAHLVAAGLSNAQIADELVISHATARTHVERIREKLGVRSRVQIARLVLDEAPAP